MRDGDHSTPGANDAIGDGEQYVPYKAIRDAVKGREVEVFRLSASIGRAAVTISPALIPVMAALTIGVTTKRPARPSAAASAAGQTSASHTASSMSSGSRKAATSTRPRSVLPRLSAAPT